MAGIFAMENHLPSEDESSSDEKEVKIGGSMKDTAAKDQCLCNAGGESPESNRMRMEARLVEKPQEIVRARSSTGNYSRAA